VIDLLIRDGTIVDGTGTAPGSVAVDRGRVVAHLAPGEPLPAARRSIDARDRLVLPGVVDPHVHFYGEGIGEFSRLAALGGVTTFMGFLRGRPEDRLVDLVAGARQEGEAKSVVDFGFHLVLYERASVLQELPAAVAAGVRSFKLFLAYKRRGMMVSERFLLDAMAAVRAAGGLAMVHAEDGELIDWLEARAQAAGRRGLDAYPTSRPALAEALAVHLAGACARVTGCPTYIVHLSSAAGLEAVEAARREGAGLTVETCPQYLLLDDAALREHGPPAKVAPPLRSPHDREALATALAAGRIDTVGSDHASHPRAAKEEGRADIFAAPFGMPGAPTLWPAMYTWAAARGVPLPVLVRAMAETPARLFGLGDRKGHVRPGADADLIIVDPAARRVVDAEALWPATAPSPFAGRPLGGWPDVTIVRGRVVCEHGEVVGEAGGGRFVSQGEGR
jgi:dihydropyrimidinase